jgi:hypothetical protein
MFVPIFSIMAKEEDTKLKILEIGLDKASQVGVKR